MIAFMLRNHNVVYETNVRIPSDSNEVIEIICRDVAITFTPIEIWILPSALTAQVFQCIVFQYNCNCIVQLFEPEVFPM